MFDTKPLQSWLRSPANVVASLLVILGFGLASLDWGFLAISAVGTFGPGILRELGWLRDKDELQMQAARRAGYHAYLTGGLLVFLVVALFRSQAGPTDEPTPLAHPAALMTIVLAVMWFTWLISSLLSYWGPHKTARRVLYSFGSVWLLFNILSGEGDWLASAIQSLLAVPFFALGWAGNRWPRVAGVILLAVAGFFFYFFQLSEVFTDPLGCERTVVLILFLGPLLASGLALLASRPQSPILEATE